MNDRTLATYWSRLRSVPRRFGVEFRLVTRAVRRAWRQRVVPVIAERLRATAERLAPSGEAPADPFLRVVCAAEDVREAAAAAAREAAEEAAAAATARVEALRTEDNERFRRLQLEVAAHQQLFPVLSAQLAGTTTHAESHVLTVCERFEAIAEKARAHVGELTAMLAGGVGFDDGTKDFGDLLIQAGDLLNTIVEDLVGATSVMESGAGRVKKLQRGFDEIEIVTQRVADIASATKMLAVNARIEASHVGAAGRGVAIVAEEMAELSERSAATAAAILTIVGGLSEEVREAAKGFSEGAESNELRVGDLRPRLADALASLAEGHERLRDGLVESSERGEALAKDVNSAVVGLQFQDRAAQRIAHVTEALCEYHEAIDAVLGAEDVAEDPEFVARETAIRESIQARYTMVEERQAHTEASGEAVDVVADDADDDGIELF